jgi:hypothetical protein
MPDTKDMELSVINENDSFIQTCVYSQWICYGVDAMSLEYNYPHNLKCAKILNENNNE